MNHSKPVIVYTDGACRGNPGRGGWGALMEYGKHTKELSGAEPDTTNNRMEMMAAIRAIEALKRSSVIHLHTDSVYLKDGITKWLANWKANGWKTANKKPVKNQDLWERLDAAITDHHVKWFWVKGHNGHPGNERADLLATSAAKNILV
jgi:ribonuclease HI